MAPKNAKPCIFFTRGLCRYGDSCTFVHEQATGTESNGKSVAPALMTAEEINIKPTNTTPVNEKSKSNQVCTYFMRGRCIRGDACHFAHTSPIAPVPQVNPERIFGEASPSQRLEASPQTTQDSRAKVTCMFFSTPKGCRNETCPYLHAVDGHEAEKGSNQDYETVEDEDQENEDDFIRNLSGAIVSFDGIGHVLKVSLPTDFSIACITGIKPGATSETVAKILRDFGYNIGVDCIRISVHSASFETTALVKVEDPLFAQELSATLKSQKSDLCAVPARINIQGSDCRKVHVSWHKATRSVWVNYGNGEIANRVAQKFNGNIYKILGQVVKCSAAKHSPARGRWQGFSQSSVAWTIILSDVPYNTTTKDIEKAIQMPFDRPRHVELGPVSYYASDSEVSVEIRSRLEEHGQLESFYLSPTSKGKRVKAAALFQDEADARSACSLNGTRLPVLKGGKLTVTLVQSAKIKLQTLFYLASKSRIDEESKIWKDHQIALHIYPSTSQKFTTLKIEGTNSKEWASALRTLDEISNGIVLRDGESVIWTPTLNTNGSTYQKLKAIEIELNVVIYRNKSKRQLHFYGPREKLEQAAARITKVIDQESSKSYEINLNPDQFSWMVRGGFNSVQRALGKDVAVFNVVSKSISVSGTQQQYETTSAIVNGKIDTKNVDAPNQPSVPEVDCPICFCEADNPLQTSCKHVYCLGCFEDYCKSAASTSKNNFQVKCQGDEGVCSTIFTLRDMKEWLSSSVFETVLKSSFEEYVQRHPETFRYCPTPDCGYIYRCAQERGPKQQTYSCPHCFESTCTSCHIRHGDYTCAEYKEIASGGYEALKKLKKELNIKDCPKCTTPMEKTEGCNHMTCQGCKAHICWVCMAVFESSGPCYAHMNKEHGGIGLGDHFVIF